MSERNHSTPAWWHGFSGRTKTVLAVGAVLALVAGFLLYDALRPGTASAQTQTSNRNLSRTAAARPAKPRSSSPGQQVLGNAERGRAVAAPPGLAAKVNGQPIDYKTLVEVCLRRYGETVLDELINKKILEQECVQRRITISPAEIDAEIDASASRAGMNREGYLEFSKEQHGVSAETLVKDIIWPRLALKRLAGAGIAVTPKELQESFESNFGVRVKARMIMCKEKRVAIQVWEKAKRAIESGHPEEFARLANEYSTDPGSRSLGGLIQPIHKYSGMPELEKEAFGLREGELSSIVEVHGHYIILLCEGRTTPMKVTMAEVEDSLREDIYEKKVKQTALTLFDQLKDASSIENYLTHTRKDAKVASKRPAADAFSQAKGPRPPRTASGTAQPRPQVRRR